MAYESQFAGLINEALKGGNEHIATFILVRRFPCIFSSFMRLSEAHSHSSRSAKSSCVLECARQRDGHRRRRRDGRRAPRQATRASALILIKLVFSVDVKERVNVIYIKLHAKYKKQAAVERRERTLQWELYPRAKRLFGPIAPRQVE